MMNPILKQHEVLACELHVAIIMDGSGRWAVRRGLARMEGHRAGLKAAREAVEFALEKGVRCLTLYAFSADNWRRPTLEVNGIFWLLRAFLRLECERMFRRGVCIEVVGRRDRLAAKVLKAITAAEARTSGGRKLRLRVAIDYSSREAIVEAAMEAISTKHFPLSGSSGTLKSKVEQMLGANEDVDLLIRTGGEKRLSDFLLWESAYAELVFIDQLWPEFNRSDFANAIEEFSKRERRYGGLTPTLLQQGCPTLEIATDGGQSL